MAYDANDPADKKIVADAVKAAVDAALAEAVTEHEADVAGLKKKNTDLLAKLKAGENADPAEMARLEIELENTQKELKDSKKELVKAQKAVEESNVKLNEESKFAESLLVDGGLTTALAQANVAPDFLPAVTALLRSQITVQTTADGRKAVVGDKALGDFVKEWSQGDQGKAFVSAPLNGGGNGPGGKAATGKTMTRAAWDALNSTSPAEASAVMLSGVTLTDA